MARRRGVELAQDRALPGGALVGPVLEGPWRREEPRRYYALVGWMVGLAIVAVVVAVGIGVGYALACVARLVAP